MTYTYEFVLDGKVMKQKKREFCTNIVPMAVEDLPRIMDAKFRTFEIRVTKTTRDEDRAARKVEKLEF
jgi:hypothetical protein